MLETEWNTTKKAVALHYNASRLDFSPTDTTLLTSCGSTGFHWRNVYTRNVKIKEGSVPFGTDDSTFGRIWVKDTTPQQLWFTDEDGTDTQIV